MVNYSKWDVILNWCNWFPDNTFIAIVQTSNNPRFVKEFIADSLEEAEQEAKKHCEIHGWKFLGIFPAKEVLQYKAKYSYRWKILLLKEKGLEVD